MKVKGIRILSSRRIQVITLPKRGIYKGLRVSKAIKKAYLISKLGFFSGVRKSIIQKIKNKFVSMVKTTHGLIKKVSEFKKKRPVLFSIIRDTPLTIYKLHKKGVTHKIIKSFITKGKKILKTKLINLKQISKAIINKSIIKHKSIYKRIISKSISILKSRLPKLEREITTALKRIRK
jgi:hypothetical protein